MGHSANNYDENKLSKHDSHSDLAIDAQQKEELLQEWRESASYKLGYCASTISLAIMFFENGDTLRAIETLRNTQKLMRDKP